MLTPLSAARLGWSWVSTGRTRVGSALPAMGPVPPGLDHDAFDRGVRLPARARRTCRSSTSRQGYPPGHRLARPGSATCQCGRHRRSRRRSGNARICPVTPVSDRPSGRHPIVRARIVTSRCHAVRVRVWTMRQFTGPQDRPSSREKPAPRPDTARRCRATGNEPRTRGPHTRPTKRTRPPRRRMSLAQRHRARRAASWRPTRSATRRCQVVNDRPLPVNLPGAQVRQ